MKCNTGKRTLISDKKYILSSIRSTRSACGILFPYENLLIRVFLTTDFLEKMIIYRILLLPVILLSLDLARDVFALHTSFCIRFPPDSVLDDTYGATGESNIATVGIEKFPSNMWNKYIQSFEGDNDGLGEPIKNLGYISEYETGLSLHVHPIIGRTEGDDPLAGWLRVEVSLPLEGAFVTLVRSFILFATDEQANFVGTFEYQPFPDDVQDCPPSDATKYMILPCGGVSKFEPFVSNVILYARNNSKTGPKFPDKYKQYWPIVPDLDERYKLNFYYRYSKQTSNKNKESYIILRLLVDADEHYQEEKLSEIVHYPYRLITTSAWFRIVDGSIPGAADPLPSDRTSLSCSRSTKSPVGVEHQIIQFADFYTKGTYLEFNWQWYFDKFYSDPLVEAQIPGTGINPATGLSGIYSNTLYTKTGCSAKFFGGRCDGTLCRQLEKRLTNSQRQSANINQIPQVRSKADNCVCSNFFANVICRNENPETPKKFNNKATTFHDCLAHYRRQIQGDRCNMTKDEADRVKIRVIRRKPKNHTKITLVEGGVEEITLNNTAGGLKTKTRESLDRRGVRIFGFGTALYAVRKGHGVLMLIMSMFCAPVSMFVSRYYKESFMSTHILYSRVWFQMHLQLLFWMFALFVAGITLALVGRKFLGESLVWTGLLHRAFGWVTVIIFSVLVLTGGIRMFDDPGRCCTIALHWGLGYLFYALNIFSIVSSIHIPGSPIASQDKSVSEERSREAANWMYMVIALWIIFELVVQVAMNFLLRLYDRWMQVAEPRKYFPPLIGVPIPVLKENSSSDASGGGIRLIAICTYIGVTALWTIFGIFICINTELDFDKNLGFGPMRCTHELNESITGQGYLFSGKYQFRRFVDSTCLY